MEKTSPECPISFDELLGKHILAGITFVSRAGEFIEQVQKHGIVESVDSERGVYMTLKGDQADENYWLPPALDAYRAAAPGEYRLKRTGEIVINPDYICMWTVTKK